jgi:hypothetical protein
MSYGGMKQFFILTICLLAANVSKAQTSQQLDSLRKKFLEAIKNTPPPPDSILRKKRQIRLKPPDTLRLVNIHPFKPLVFPPIFESSFFENAKANQDTIAITFYTVEIGTIYVETGKIIACDPIVMRDAHPFGQRFPKGSFPVQLSIAKYDNDERVAFSRIYFSDHPVAKWEFAVAKGKKQIPLASKDFYGYGVDGGEGVFIDSAANEDFTRMSNKDEDLWETVFSDEMAKNYHNTWEFMVYDFGGHKLACFSTGFGDGTYATYVGYDANGKICRLLTDFGLISWWGKKK